MSKHYITSLQHSLDTEFVADDLTHPLTELKPDLHVNLPE